MQEKRWEDVYEEIKASEMLIFDSLVSGQALEEHMETYYLSTLQQCVEKLILQAGAEGPSGLMRTAPTPKRADTEEQR